MDDLYVGGLVATTCATPNTPLTGRDPQEATAALDRKRPGTVGGLGIRVGRGVTTSGGGPAA